VLVTRTGFRQNISPRTTTTRNDKRPSQQAALDSQVVLVRADSLVLFFFESDAVLDFLCSRTLIARLPMRGTSGSVRRSPANPARPGREQRYRDRFVRRGVPEVPLICRVRAIFVVLCEPLRTLR
jgi:hypothetical protein